MRGGQGGGQVECARPREIEVDAASPGAGIQPVTAELREHLEPGIRRAPWARIPRAIGYRTRPEVEPVDLPLVAQSKLDLRQPGQTAREAVVHQHHLAVHQIQVPLPQEELQGAGVVRLEAPETQDTDTPIGETAQAEPRPHQSQGTDLGRPQAQGGGQVQVQLQGPEAQEVGAPARVCQHHLLQGKARRPARQMERHPAHPQRIAQPLAQGRGELIPILIDERQGETGGADQNRQQDQGGDPEGDQARQGAAQETDHRKKGRGPRAKVRAAA